LLATFIAFLTLTAAALDHVFDVRGVESLGGGAIVFRHW
jgi:hypothetical protein